MVEVVAPNSVILKEQGQRVHERTRQQLQRTSFSPNDRVSAKVSYVQSTQVMRKRRDDRPANNRVGKLVVLLEVALTSSWGNI
jgi:hypothetical protein